MERAVNIYLTEQSLGKVLLRGSNTGRVGAHPHPETSHHSGVVAVRHVPRRPRSHRSSSANSDAASHLALLMVVPHLVLRDLLPETLDHLELLESLLGHLVERRVGRHARHPAADGRAAASSSVLARHRRRHHAAAAVAVGAELLHRRRREVIHRGHHAGGAVGHGAHGVHSAVALAHHAVRGAAAAAPVEIGGHRMRTGHRAVRHHRVRHRVPAGIRDELLVAHVGGAVRLTV